jgi:predicted dehydrogenase
LMLDPNRVYADYEELLAKESALPYEERIDLVSIVTPNHMHFGPAKKALALGFHVVLDKPMTLTYAEALDLYKTVKSSHAMFCLTHTYTGYPMIKQMKQMIAQGEIGVVKKVHVEYPQGWLYRLLEYENKQASWRTDPQRNGKAGCFGDIGTHAFNLAEYVTGLEVKEICASLYTKVAGRPIDDDGALFMHFSNGANGVLTASQVNTGAENNLKIRVYGDLGGLEWEQEQNNSLIVRWPDRPAEIYRAGTGYLGSLAKANTRTPAGHPEGYIEAFANIYRNFARTIYAQQKGEEPLAEWLDFPGAEEGIRGMAFIDQVLKSSASSQKWLPFLVNKD